MSESDGSKLTARVGLRIHGLSRKCIDQRHSRMWYCKYNPDHHYRQTRTGADCWESMRASESAFLKVQNTTVFGLEKTNFGRGQRLSSKITQAPAHQCAGPVQFWRQKNKSKIVCFQKKISERDSTSQAAWFRRWGCLIIFCTIDSEIWLRIMLIDWQFLHVLYNLLII